MVSLLSHELTHVLIESKWSLSRVPWLIENSNRSKMGLLWKEEGYAEYISGGTGYSFEEGMSYLNKYSFSLKELLLIQGIRIA